MLGQAETMIPSRVSMLQAEVFPLWELIPMNCARSQRHFDSHPGTLALIARNRQLSPQYRADRFNDRESQSGAAQMSRSGFVCAVETLAYMRQRFSGNSNSGIADLEHCLIFPGVDQKLHRAACGRVLDGVVKKIDDNLLDEPGVAFHGRVG